MPTWKDINQDTLENFQINFNRYMKFFTSKLSSKNVKRLDTNETVIKSKNGETYINGPTLEMKDSDGTLRLKQGWDVEELLFVFKLYNTLGLITVDIDSNGELVVEKGTFKGDIITEKNATIGELLKLISPTGTFNSGIQMIAPDGVTLLSRMLRVAADLLITNYGSGDIDLISGGDIHIQPSDSTVMTANSYIGTKTENNLIATHDWVATWFSPRTEATGSFVTVDEKIVTVDNGIITSIT